MSSKIYFSGKVRKSPAYYFMRGLSSTAHAIVPKLALHQTRKLLLTPTKSKRIITQPAAIKRSFLQTDIGRLAIYRVGTGPKVLLTHGWSGSASQFFSLMDKIASAGFEAVAFDHVAHGQSSEHFANLPIFIKGLNAAINHIKNEPIACVISHSMGAVAALNLTKEYKHLLIAPAFNFYASFEQSILRTGLTPKLFTRLIKEVEEVHQVRFIDLLPESHLARTQKPVHIVHDNQDRFAQYQYSAEQSALYSHVTLSTTQGHGHGRVIDSQDTLQAFLALTTQK